MFAQRISLKPAIVAIAMLGVIGLSPNSAGAWAWSSTVTISGRVTCNAVGPVAGVWVEATNGERGWAALGKGPYNSDTNGVPFTYTLKKVPGGGTTVQLNIGCGWRNGQWQQSYSRSVGVKRPAVGTTAGLPHYILS